MKTTAHDVVVKSCDMSLPMPEPLLSSVYIFAPSATIGTKTSDNKPNARTPPVLLYPI